MPVSIRMRAIKTGFRLHFQLDTLADTLTLTWAGTQQASPASSEGLGGDEGSRAWDGGAGRSRTDLHGFAIRCITALLPRLSKKASGAQPGPPEKREAHSHGLPFGRWSGKRVMH